MTTTATIATQDRQPTRGSSRGSDLTKRLNVYVVFSDGVGSVDATTATKADQYGATVTHVYSAALHGFAATMTESHAKRLAADPDIAYVQQNATVKLLDTVARRSR